MKIKLFAVGALALAMTACGGSKSETSEKSEEKDAVESMKDEAEKAAREIMSSVPDADDIDLTEIDMEEVMDEPAEEVPSSSSSADWDDVLDSYENYVDKYITLAKKVEAGDMSAMAEYTSLMEEAQELGERLDGAKGEMSASQMARYNKIAMKMLNAGR